MKYFGKYRKRTHIVRGLDIIQLVFGSLITLVSVPVNAGYYFNPAFLSNDSSAVADLSHLSRADAQVPGIYRVDVYLNDTYVFTRDINFVTSSSENIGAGTTSEGVTDLQPCLTLKTLDSLGVNIKAFPDLQNTTLNSCANLERSIQAAKATLDFEKLRLDISIPQAALRNDARGYIPSEQWDEGINAFLLNYNFAGSNSKNEGSNNASEFLSLQNGLNLGPWRLRDNSSWSYSKYAGETQNDWQHISTYLERAIIPLKGELTVGDTSTTNDVFDSLPIRGIKLASDDNMLPDSMKGFAPTIRGIAKSNAKVTIKQNGYTIYQTYVSPGAFAINDLFPTSSSGDLEVSISETDGSVQNYVVPYSAVPLLQREGRVKYAFSVAEYRSSDDNQDDPGFGQGTIIWGLANGLTFYGGTQFSSNYRSFALGLGENLGDFGAISMDITHATSTLADNNDYNGQSFRFLYAKALNEWGTNFQLMGYRYSTQGFYTLDETSYKKMNGYNDSYRQVDEKGNELPPVYDSYYNLYYSKRGRIQVNISQQVGVSGSIYVTGSQQSYWNTDELDSLLQAGYSGALWDISYSIAYNYSKSTGQPSADQMFSLNLSLPIGKWLSPTNGDNDINQTANNAYATYSNNTDSHGNINQQAGISGTLLKDNNLNYSVMEGYGNNGVGNSGMLNLGYQGAYGNLNGGYNYSSAYQQVNYGMAGGIVLHRNGLTLGQPLGDTNVLVAAPGGDNITVENYNGVKTDWRGYAVVPYAATYRRNRIALDTTTLNNHTDIDDAVVSVVPTQGALVRAQFNARVGVRGLLTIYHNGKPLPFGATVSQTDINNGSIVGENGQVYLSGLPLKGKLNAQWGNGGDKQCTASYSLPQDSLQMTLVYEKLICQ